MPTTAPPISSHTDLSVGEPVNARETSELNECDACKPKNNIMTPPTSSAMDTALFIFVPPFVVAHCSNIFGISAKQVKPAEFVP